MQFHCRFCEAAALISWIAFAAHGAEIDPATVTSLTPPEATALVEQGHDPLELPRLESLTARPRGRWPSPAAG